MTRSIGGIAAYLSVPTGIVASGAGVGKRLVVPMLPIALPAPRGVLLPRLLA